MNCWNRNTETSLFKVYVIWPPASEDDQHQMPQRKLQEAAQYGVMK